MALSKRNVIYGAARVYLGPATDSNAAAASSRPAMVNGTRYTTTMNGANGSTNTGVATLVTNWNEVGYTQEGLEISNDPSFTDIEVDQAMSPVRTFKDSINFTASTTFAEATLQNLFIAWGMATTNISTVGSNLEADLDGGTLGEAPLERGLIAVGNGTENASGGQFAERIYQLYRVLAVDSSSITQGKSEATVVPVSFRALPNDAGRFGKLIERPNVS